MSSHPTQELKQRQEEFLALLNPVYEQLERFCFAIADDDDQAYDLIGETVLRGWVHFQSLREQKAFLAWLFTTASRLHKRIRWRARHFDTYDPRYAEELHSGGPAPDQSADVEALYTALEQLPQKQREAVVLFEINGLNLKEIVEIQGGTVSALKVRLYRARKRLTEILDVDFSEEPEHSPATINHGHQSNQSTLLTP